ncbi:signal peptide peptidase-like 2A isoform X4 [Hippocampus comes]|uniref:signal peptide peptidase-like 2A isoform X4 n=1 Tax=Hippocampus comes TaxID=109280 RepID=UPI00094ED8F2|nr:PREDICTED: signal peptide peptidase-like 2A isoform X4 [Hippocampus comes]
MDTAVIFVFMTVTFLTSQINCQEAILHISSASTEQEFCILYNHSWTPLPESLDATVPYPVVNLTSTMLCDPSGVSPEVVKGNAVVVMRGDCTFSQKALVAQSLGATTLLIASNITLIPPSANGSEYSKVQIPLALMRYRDFVEAQRVFGDEMQARLYAPPSSWIDGSIGVMLLISIVTVALGGYWSGACERERLNSGAGGANGDNKAESGDIALYSPCKVVIFVGLMFGMLFLMYYFYNILIYVMIAIFCIASATALFSCIDAVLEKLGCAHGNFTVLNANFSLRSLILASVCICISVVWAVYRNEDRWIWILQDLLGVAFCLNFIRTISLSSFKICVILLTLLLVYDVFFVFITPFFTKDGVSIMVQVALGPGASEEKLPVVMRVPWFSAWAQNLCGMQFSILGYGDIIVPGLLVAYCSRFDVWINSTKKIYFFSCCIAYLLGMITTFAVMLLSRMGQPALLYLVPFTLITSVTVAACRGEIRQFWNGTSYEVLDSSQEPLLSEARSDHPIEAEPC